MKASLPPPLDGLDPRWSRLVPVVDADGVERTFHVLDSAALDDSSDARTSAGTLLCVHGNPTWSFLWRRLVAAPPPGWRVVALDQLGMGFSERPPGVRRLARRIDDLGRLSAALGIDGPVVTVAHDWGGVISLGWAAAHRDQMAGIVLTNTAVHQPPSAAAPALIRLARTPGVRQVICQWTPAFLLTAAALSRPPLPRAARRGMAAPYRGPRRRRAIADFVADIPLDADHPSAPALADVVASLPSLADVPALLIWGARDPVFSDRYLNDVSSRLPGAQVHRFGRASHLVTEDRPEIAPMISDWVTAGRRSLPAGEPSTATAALEAALVARAGGDRAGAAAVVEPGRDPVSFAELQRRVDDAAAGLRSIGVRRGQRVALLVPPGVELTVAVYACWRIGAVIVVADAGLGLRRLGNALRSAGGQYVIGSAKGLAAARLLRVPGVRILAGPGPAGLADHTLSALTVPPAATATGGGAAGGGPTGSAVEGAGIDPPPRGGDECAVVFTSGATGPPKGVVYRVRQLRAQIDLITATYHLTLDDRLVAAFAPFALYGPALGIASAVPAMDVTAPATLTAAALADAIQSVDATVVFASPAALRNVVATSARLSDAQRAAMRRPRLVMSAGAPLQPELLRQVAGLLSGAEIHTPYGMTEVLPVTDISLEQIEDAGNGVGVCVGLPVDGVQVGISPLDAGGDALRPPQYAVDVPGEICVRAAHAKDRYDRLWLTEATSSRDAGWHRTGDVGHLDAAGRLWMEGRLTDVITTERGPVTPVPAEQRVQRLDEIRSAALVGVGPAGHQQIVAIVVPADVRPAAPRRTSGGRASGLALAPSALASTVRSAAEVELAAVLTTASLPVDIRHNSKIDHLALSRSAAKLLSGSSRLRR